MGSCGAEVELSTADLTIAGSITALCTKVFLGETLNSTLLLVVTGWRQRVSQWVTGTVTVKDFGPSKMVYAIQ